MMTIKICIECKHHRLPVAGGNECVHPENVSLVTGEYQSCLAARMGKGHCKKAGLNWEYFDWNAERARRVAEIGQA